MSPLGKFSFALIGLRAFGATGFLLGMLFGHIFVDRTQIIKKIERYLSIVDDNIRLMLPYKYYRFYNRIDGNFWGKAWGGLLGAVLFGANGFILLFIMGHYLFDTPNSKHAKKIRKNIDYFWNQNLGKIAGGIIGFSLHSSILTFVGVVIGFFVDYFRLESGCLAKVQWVKSFWLSINHLKIMLNSKQAKHIAFVKAVAGLAAKVAKVDGVVSVNEIKTFKTLFNVTDEESSYISKVFNKEKSSVNGYEKYANQLKNITDENLELKENIIENLFKIATADCVISSKEILFLEKIAKKIGLPDGNFEVIRKRFEPKSSNSTVQNYYEILGVLCNASDAEIKNKWKTLLAKHHPDIMQANGASEKEILDATNFVAEINNAYQQIMNSRKVA